MDELMNEFIASQKIDGTLLHGMARLMGGYDQYSETIDLFLFHAAKELYNELFYEQQKTYGAFIDERLKAYCIHCEADEIAYAIGREHFADSMKKRRDRDLAYNPFYTRTKATRRHKRSSGHRRIESIGSIPVYKLAERELVLCLSRYSRTEEWKDLKKLTKVTIPEAVDLFAIDIWADSFEAQSEFDYEKKLQQLKGTYKCLRSWRPMTLSEFSELIWYMTDFLRKRSPYLNMDFYTIEKRLYYSTFLMVIEYFKASNLYEKMKQNRFQSQEIIMEALRDVYSWPTYQLRKIAFKKWFLPISQGLIPYIQFRFKDRESPFRHILKTIYENANVSQDDFGTALIELMNICEVAPDYDNFGDTRFAFGAEDEEIFTYIRGALLSSSG